MKYERTGVDENAVLDELKEENPKMFAKQHKPHHSFNPEIWY